MPKLITHDRYEGLDPKIAEALKNFKTVEGEAWNKFDSDKKKVELRDYNRISEWPFRCYVIRTNEELGFRNFTPAYKEETDWSKVKVDAKVILTDDNGEKYNVHFAKYHLGWVYFYQQGKTSWTEKTTMAAYKHQCRLAKEGE